MSFRGLTALALLGAMLWACAPAEDASTPDGPSPAADALIESAASEEEREELATVRDEVDAQKRAEAEALDAEIERLERENAELRSGR